MLGPEDACEFADAVEDRWRGGSAEAAEGAEGGVCEEGREREGC